MPTMHLAGIEAPGATLISDPRYVLSPIFTGKVVCLLWVQTDEFRPPRITRFPTSTRSVKSILCEDPIIEPSPNIKRGSIGLKTSGSGIELISFQRKTSQ